MSQEQVLKTLVGLGLTRLDSQVYIHLAKRGPQKGQDLSKGLKVQKQQLYRSLKNLQSKGIVTSTLEHPARFNAVSFDKVVDIFIKAKMAEAQHIQEQKTDLLANWQAINLGETVDATAKFNVIEGRGPIYAKILQMMNETTNQLSTITTITGLLRADQFGLFEPGIENRLRPRITFRALTELSEQNLSVTKKFLKEITNAKTNFEGRTPDLSLTLPQMVIRDEEEILFFITSKMNAPATEQEEICLWTNCKSLVQAFTAVFEDFWRNSTNINGKIIEIETGKPSPKTFVIKDAETAYKKYDEILASAEKEIFVMTSTKGSFDLLKRIVQLKEWRRRGVSMKIMTPINSENFEAAQLLSECCDVKHISTGYIDSTVVDGRHLFQFKNPSSSQEKVESMAFFEDTFYTSEMEYVGKTKNMLDAIWKTAQAPSAIILGSINKTTAAPDIPPFDNPHTRTIRKIYQVSVAVEEEKAKQPTGQDILESFLSAQKPTFAAKSRGIPVTYSTNGQAVIHPPSHLNLPDTLFHIYHIEKHSTFGAEDMITVNLWLQTPTGCAFVPAAIITNNFEAAKLWKKCCAGSPAENNVHVIKDSEIDVRLYGNTLFAGWTVTIPLPNPFTLPPSCLLIEGYGESKPVVYDISIPSGFTLKCSGNSLGAFVTFLHPSSKYSGPGTDGCIEKDLVIEWHPPQTKPYTK